MHLLLIEDDPLIGTMVRLNLRAQGYTVAWKTSGEAGLDVLRGDRVDLILLDVGLPGCDGIETAQRIRAAGIGTPILMLTARDDVPSKVAALAAGADDYLCKPFDLDELLARVQALIRRSQGSLEVPADQELRIGQARLNLARRALQSPDGTWHALSDKEAALLRFLARHPGRTLSRADLLEEVWGMQSSPTERTVDNFVMRLRRLVEPEPEQPRHLVTVRGWGYRFEP